MKRAGIELRSISEGLDFGTKYGKAMLGMFAVMAELERDIIRETMLENRIARGRRGIPTAGSLPYGRQYNKKTGKWKLDKEAAMQIRLTAEQYLQGSSLYDLSKALGMSYPNLIRTMTECSGDEWTVNFQGEEPITYKVPRILPEDTIQRIRDRLAFNYRNNRTDITNKYLLSGFLYCEHCGLSLSGQTQSSSYKSKSYMYRYYAHVSRTTSKCKAYFIIPLEPIERAVFKTIFDNIVDVPSFEKAIAESMPDENMVQDLKQKIKSQEKELKSTARELEKLVNLALSGTLTKETIKNKEQSLIQTKVKLKESLLEDKNKLQSFPNINMMKHEAERIRRQLLERYGGKERLQEMTFDEKRAMLHWLFDGKDQKGKPYGIYINKTGRGKEQKIDYFMYGRIVGLRTLKGDDIDYYEDENIFKTNKTAYLQC